MEGIKIEKLNLPSFEMRIIQQQGKTVIFDPFRKKHVRLTPEEWVRQNFAQYLVRYKNYPAGLISTETLVKIGDKKNRSDILIYNNSAEIIAVVECKAPTVTINQNIFDQVAAYNYQLQTHYLMISNGLVHYCCKINPDKKRYDFLKEIPFYKEIG